MKQLLIISGKGGTGKTMLSGCLAVLAKDKVMVDADVDAANLHLILKPKVKETHEFVGGKIARIDEDVCTKCGSCKEVCRFGAISEDLQVISVLCEGCTICSYFCDTGALVLEDRISGVYYISETRYGTFVHARLGIAQENSGKLVAKLREVAKELAKSQNKELIVIDGPPGVGCPVMASMSGVDLVIGITEPTLSGMHDLQRVIELCKHFKVELKVVINKFDLNLGMSEEMEKNLKEQGIQVIGKIPFSEAVVESVKLGKPFLEYFQETSKGKEVESEIKKIWESVRASLGVH